MFPWKRKNHETGEEVVTMVQGAYRDAGPLKEYVFPEECLQEVVNMLDVRSNDYAISDFKMAAMRKMVGAKKVPKKIKTPKNFPFLGLISPKEDGSVSYQPYRFVESQGVAFHVVGIRKDKRGVMTEKDGVEWEQELL